MNGAIYKQPLMLFLGAGASASLGKMTTDQFFKWLISKSYEPRSKLAMVPQIAEAVRNRNKTKMKATDEIEMKVDVEAILDVAEQVVEGAELEDLIRKELRMSVPSIRPYLEDVVALRDQIRDLVIEHYSEIDIVEALGLYSPLLSLAKSHPLPVFTTNYDLAIEKMHEIGFVIDGFERGKLTPEWSRYVYDLHRPTGEPELILFKLHGSVDWHRTPREAIQRYESGKRDPGIVIAYPSRLKREIHEEPFRTNYDYLLACLLHAKLCAVIGFSFRDQEIVEELRQAMELNKHLELMIIDPKAEAIKAHLQNKLGFKPKAELITEEFTAESAPSIADRIKAKVDMAS